MDFTNVLPPPPKEGGRDSEFQISLAPTTPAKTIPSSRPVTSSPRDRVVESRSHGVEGAGHLVTCDASTCVSSTRQLKPIPTTQDIPISQAFPDQLQDPTRRDPGGHLAALAAAASQVPSCSSDNRRLSQDQTAASDSRQAWLKRMYCDPMAANDAASIATSSIAPPSMLHQLSTIGWKTSANPTLSQLINQNLFKGSNSCNAGKHSIPDKKSCQHKGPILSALNHNFFPDRTKSMEPTQVLPFPRTHAFQGAGNKLDNLLPRQAINLVEGETRSITREYGMTNPQSSNKDKDLHLLESITANIDNPIISAEDGSSKQLQVEEHLEEIGGLDLNKTPQQKARRKKHRPKVVREDKPTKTPSKTTPLKPQTPVPTNEQNPNGKRKYVRKNKASHPSGVDVSLHEILDGSGRKRPVRRSLEMDLNDQKTNADTETTSKVSCTTRTGEYETRGEQGLNSTVMQNASKRDATEKLVVGTSELNPTNILNQMPNRFQNIPESATPEPQLVNGLNRVQSSSVVPAEDHPMLCQPSREIQRDNIKNLSRNSEKTVLPSAADGSGLDVLSKGTKRGQKLVIDSINTAQLTEMNFTNDSEVNQSREFSETSHFYNSNAMPKRRKILTLDEITSRTTSPSMAYAYGGNLQTPAKPSVTSWSTSISFNQPKTSENQSRYSKDASEWQALPEGFKKEQVIWNQTKPKGNPGRSTIPRSAVQPSMNPIENLVQRFWFLNLHGTHEGALVPYAGSSALVPYDHHMGFMKKRRPRAKVHLDTETSRVWKLLMLKDSIHDDGELDSDKKKWWQEERKVFRGRVDSFIARMHLVQGDRRFSPWKGSVVDSVVGVFLTQNVSDHLSSSAFMSMAARFPIRPRETNELKPETASTSGGQPSSCISSPSSSKGFQTKMVEHEFFNQSSISIYDVEKINEQISKHNYSIETDPVDEQVQLVTGIGRIPQDSSTDSSVTAVSSNKSVGNEDKRSPDDIASSQTSAFSSQNSSEYLVRTDEPVGTCTELNLNSEELFARRMYDNLERFTSFTDLLKMAEMNMFPSVHTVGNGRISYSDNLGAINSSENISDEEGSSGTKLKDQTSSRSQQVQFLGVKTYTCTSMNTSDSSNSWIVNAERTREARAECSINTDMRCNAHTKVAAGTADQQSSLVSRSMPLTGDLESSTNMTRQPLGNLEKETHSGEQFCCSHSPQMENSLSLDDNNFQSINVSQGRNSPEHRQMAFHAENDANTVGAAAGVQAQKGDPTINLHFMKQQDSITKPADLMTAKPNEIVDSQRGAKAAHETKLKKINSGKEKNNFDWDSLRERVCHGKLQKERCSNAKDSVDWEAVRRASVEEISDTIRERGMNNVLAERIKDFLDRLVRDHGAIDLEWLRDTPPEKVKDYLLSIRGLGLKSVECVRLLTLHHLAFPVDTNVGRISVRLGWVPLQPLPESLQLHLLEMYPVLETIQKYLWPRLCTLDQRTLYELHYQLITFGKVFCTKSKPNCNACPMRAECKHFASAFASARLALPGPEGSNTIQAVVPIVSENNQHVNLHPMPLPQLEGCIPPPGRTSVQNSEPVIEEPASPEPEDIEITQKDIEDAFYEDPDEIPTIKLNLEEFTQNLQNYMEENICELQDGDMSKALVALSPQLASIPMPKLKNISRLRTEHQVYELPDSHPLLDGLDRRDQDDPCSYLLAIWTPGETAQSTEPPEIRCKSGETGQLCNKNTCFGCNSIREAQTRMVRGTLLIPCRTAMRGIFPLNGTYFQVNEVFADHDSSHEPIFVPREWIWNLPRRTVYFGTSIPTIFRGLTTEGIQHCFWRGFVCVRGFDRTTKAPKPLFARLHFPASKATKNKTASSKEKTN